MALKKVFLLLSAVLVSGIGMLYGISPEWFASTFLGIAELDANIAHVFRAVMCLYIGFGLFWGFSAFCEQYRNPALLTLIIFCAGLVVGRIVSVLVDGAPAPLLQFYIAVELAVLPVAWWIYKRPE